VKVRREECGRCEENKRKKKKKKEKKDGKGRSWFVRTTRRPETRDRSASCWSNQRAHPHPHLGSLLLLSLLVRVDQARVHSHPCVFSPLRSNKACQRHSRNPVFFARTSRTNAQDLHSTEPSPEQRWGDKPKKWHVTVPKPEHVRVRISTMFATNPHIYLFLFLCDFLCMLLFFLLWRRGTVLEALFFLCRCCLDGGCCFTVKIRPLSIFWPLVFCVMI